MPIVDERPRSRIVPVRAWQLPPATAGRFASAAAGSPPAVSRSPAAAAHPPPAAGPPPAAVSGLQVAAGHPQVAASGPPVAARRPSAAAGGDTLGTGQPPLRIGLRELRRFEHREHPYRVPARPDGLPQRRSG